MNARQRPLEIELDAAETTAWYEERARLQAELASLRDRADRCARERDELMSHLAHELRGPLNTICGWVQLLRAGRLDAVQHERACDSIARGVQAQTVLIDRVLDASRLLRGAITLARSRVDLASCVLAAVDDLRSTAATKSIEIVTSLEARLPVDGDPARLHQIFTHILGNAIRHTPERGRIMIVASLQPGTAVVRIADSGSGIASSALESIFEPFARSQAGESPTRVQGKSLGLGLALARKLADLHGGHIRAFSEGIGRGSTFIVSLPLADASGKPRSANRTFAQEHADQP